MLKMPLLVRIITHPFLGMLMIVSFIMQQSPYIELHSCEEGLLKTLYLSTTTNILFYPSLLVVLLKKLRFIKSWRLQSFKERIPVILGMMIFFFWAWRVSSEHECLHFITTQLLLGSFIATIFMTLINNFAPFSLYALCFGSVFFSFLTSAMVVPTVWSNVLIVLLFLTYAITQVIYFRLYQNKKEWLLGFLIGISSQAIAFLLK